jgi:hypothetical protein
MCPPEQLSLAMNQSRCRDKAKVFAALDQQKPAFLSKIEVLIEQEMKIQQKILRMGHCCMGFNWLEVEGG